MYRGDKRQISGAFWSSGVLAYPTEGVWGLGCHPESATAVSQLLAVKQRQVEKGLILVTGQVEHVQFLLAPLPAVQQQQAMSYWPGHYTLLLEDVDLQVPWFIKGEHTSVAVRVSVHPFIQWFTREISPFLVSTSANLAGKPACRYHWQVQRHFANSLDYIVPGKTLGAKQPSTIIELASGANLR